MKNTFVCLILVSVLLCGCGTSGNVETDGGVKLSFSGVGESQLNAINNRLTSVFPSSSNQFNNGNLEIEIPELASSEIVKRMIEGNGVILLKPSIGEGLTLSGNKIRHVHLDMSPSGTSQVMIGMDAVSAKKWHEITEQNIGQVIEVYLDGEKIISPTVNSVISGGRTSLFGKNELETKCFYSLIKYPRDQPSNIKFLEKKIFIKNENKEVVQLENEDIEKYRSNSDYFRANKESLIEFISTINLLNTNARSMLITDVQRMADDDIETYLSATKLNTTQLRDVMNNAEKLARSHQTGMSNIKELEEVVQGMEKLLR